MQKLTPATSYKQKNKSILLHLASDIEVFDRTLSFSRASEPNKTVPLQIQEGELVYLKAGSGVGKTTVAKIIMGLIKAKNLNMNICNVRFNDKTPHTIWRKKIWAKKAGMVFQHADEALNLNSKVKDAFKGLPLRIKLSQNQLLDNLKLVFDSTLSPSFLSKKISYLSGGQKQRLNLLRTLILSTDLIILDEPLNGLDFVSTVKILKLIHKKQSEGIGMLLISHNEEIFEHMVAEDRVYHLKVKF
jgi:ABC-type dipeptide/oligopeptide/nickel transport system ATPase subunit